MTDPARESYLDRDDELGGTARRYLELLLDADRDGASRLVLDSVEAGASLRDVYLRVFQPVLWEVGRLWEINRVSVAQEHFCTAATQLVMSRLYPHLFGGERRGLTLVAASVGGNLHEVGVRMVSDFFEMEGWDTLYLGADSPATAIAEAADEHDADIVAMSITLDEHVAALEEALEALSARRESGGTRVLVGGAPFRRDPELWQRLGADGFGRDAEEAVVVGLRLATARS